MAVNEAALRQMSPTLGEERLARPAGSAKRRPRVLDWIKKIRWRPAFRTALYTATAASVIGGAALGIKQFKPEMRTEKEFTGWPSATEYVTSMHSGWEMDAVKSTSNAPEFPKTASEMLERLNAEAKPGVFYYLDKRDSGHDKIIRVEYSAAALKRAMNRVFTPEQMLKLANTYNHALLYNDETSELGRMWSRAYSFTPRGDSARMKAAPFYAARAFLPEFDSMVGSHKFIQAEKNEVLSQIPPKKLDSLKQELAALMVAKKTGGAVGGATLPALAFGGMLGLMALSELGLNSKFRRSLRRAVENGNARRVDEMLTEADLSRPDAFLLGLIPKSLVLGAGGFNEAVEQTRQPAHAIPFALRSLALLPEGVNETVPPTPIRVEGPVRMAVGVSLSNRKRGTAPPPKLPIDFPLAVTSLVETFGSMPGVPRIEIHVADEIAKLNRRLLLGESEEEAAAAVENETQQKIAAVNATVNALGLPGEKIVVARWSDLQKTPEFQRAMRLIRQSEEKGGKSFRKDLLRLLPQSVGRLIKTRAQEKVAGIAAGGETKSWIQKRVEFRQATGEFEELALEYARQDLAHALMPGLRVQHKREEPFNAAAEKMARKYGLRVAEPAKLDFSAASNMRSARKWFLKASRPGLETFEGHGFTFRRSAKTGLNYATMGATAKLSPKARPEPYLSDKAENTIFVNDLGDGTDASTATRKITAKKMTPDDAVRGFARVTPSLWHVMQAQQRGELPEGSLFGAVTKIIGAVNAATPKIKKIGRQKPARALAA